MTTLKDIANITGVSINTVSRALKDKPDIGWKTKERVRKVANTLGYTPNVLARGLALKRSFTIGLIVTELSNPVRGMFIEQLRHLITRDGYQLLVSGYSSEDEAETCIREMSGRGVDGLIMGNIDGILSELSYWSALESAMNSGVPVVTFHQTLTGKVDNIWVDYSQFTEQLTLHLIENHGLSEILYAYFDTPREEGYRRAMESAGLGANIGFVPCKGWELADARQGIIDYLEDHAAPEGIVCRNDQVAIGIINGLRDKGIRVPGDVAVVGIDNIQLAEYLNPRLTTAGVDPGSTAAEIFRMLRDRIDGTYSGEARRVKLPFKLYFRESCGCAG